MTFARLCLGLAVALGLSAASAQAAPLEAYGKLPSIEQISISPDGTRIAMAVTDGENRVIAVQDLASKQLVLRAPTGDAKVRYLEWAGDKHLILVTSRTWNPVDVITTQREWMLAFDIDVGARKVKPLLSHADDESMNTIYGTPVVRMIGGKPTAFVQGIQFISNEGRLSLFRIDLDTSATRIVETGELNTRQWLVGPTGEAAAEVLYNAGSGKWALKVKDGDHWREAVTTVAPLDPPDLLGLGPDGRSVLYSDQAADGHAVWTEVRFDGAAPHPFTPASDEEGPIHDHLDGHLVGEWGLIGDDVRYTFNDPMDAKIWKAVAAAYPGSQVTLESWSSNHRKLVVKVDSPDDGSAFALVDIDTRSARWLGAEYLGVGAHDVSPQKPIRFVARDGLELTGYLTLPRGRSAKGLPLIVFPHGGPASRDAPGFDWWAQGMASRGYAVLQVNYRGSDGLGEKLLEAGYGEWGRKMQTDLSDGVRDLAKQGIIDPKRVCIVGGSYGGYAALAGAALDPGVYRCAVSYGGISDLGRFIGWERSHNGREAYRYWNRFMGSENAGDPQLAEISPALQADKVAIPVLLIHGKDDSVVPIEQSRIMADALKKAGKTVDLIVEPGEDHWLSRGETRLQTLKATMAFVEKYDPPG